MSANVTLMVITTLLVYLFSLNAAASRTMEKAPVRNSVVSLGKCQNSAKEPVIYDNLAKQLSEHSFTLLGKAKFSVLFWDIYESQLLTSDGRHPFSNTCQHSLFEIQYLRDISKKELIENTVAQWQYLALDENEYRSFVPLLENIWPDIKAGDQLSMLNQIGMTSFYLNEKKIGDIASLTFAKAFLSIWLDKNTSEPKLRKKLLGDNI
tara:strand:- start:353 stop:976 length:624 start_codon:yes stop_codon:yes gene_type:complete